MKITAQNGFSDETFFRFMQGATIDFEGNLDAFKFFSSGNSAPNISSVINNSMDLCLNSLPELNQNTEIQIRTKTKNAGNFSLSMGGITGIPSNYCVLLEDKLNGIISDFKNDSSYDFFMADTTFTPRFALHLLRNDSLSCSDFVSLLSSEKSYIPYQNQIYFSVKNFEANIYFDLLENTNVSIAVHNLLGIKIIPEKNYPVRNSVVNIKLENYSPGIYFIVISAPEQQFTGKIFLR